MTRPAAAILLALAACDTDFDPQYLVRDLRVLSLSSHVDGSSLADGRPGDTVVLEALVANPVGRAPVTISWYGCAPTASEALPPCADPDFLRDPGRLATDERILPLGTGESISVAVPDIGAALGFVVDVALDEPSFQCRLYAEMPVVAVVEAGDARELAVKRVRLTPKIEDLARDAPSLVGAYVQNVNPSVLDVLRAPAGSGFCAGGTAIDEPPFPAGDAVLCGIAASGSVQTFNQCGPAGERDATSEDLTWQWYVTAGEFPEMDGVGNATGGAVDFTRPAVPFTLWAILRDGRGGVAWARRDLPAAP
jgi:hypothetical protein